MEEFLKIEIENRVAFISLNRPEKRNALNQKFILELITAFKKVEDNSGVKVVVLKAFGETFSAGADLEYLQQLQHNTYDENLDDSTQLKYLFQTIYSLEKPVIAQIEGDAIAGGCGLATVCDIVFSTAKPKYGYTEVKIGFVPALVTAFLIRRIGGGRAKEMLLSGELIDAKTALQYGLVNFIIDDRKITATVKNYALKLANGTSAESLKATKQLITAMDGLDLSESLDLAAKVNAQARLSGDCKRGIDAFLTKTHIDW